MKEVITTWRLIAYITRIVHTVYVLLGFVVVSYWSVSSPWRHNGRVGVSNHQPHERLLNRSFRRRSKKTPKLRVTGLCAGNSPETGEFPAQMASNAENVSIWWRHHIYTHEAKTLSLWRGIFAIFSVSASIWHTYVPFHGNNLWLNPVNLSTCYGA